MAKIKIEINSCCECPFFDRRNPWSSDGWDRMDDWYCKKSEKTIQGSVEWHEESKIVIPEWCEIKVDSITKVIEKHKEILNIMKDNRSRWDEENWSDADIRECDGMIKTLAAILGDLNRVLNKG